MFRYRPSRVPVLSLVRGRAQSRRAGPGNRCVLAVASLCAATAALLILGLFVVVVLIRPAGREAVGIIPFLFLTLIYGGLTGIHALKRAHKGARLYGGEGMAVAAIVLNALPAFFVVIWVCIAILPLHVESSWVGLQDGCSSLAQAVYQLASKR
jgi:hypothetical protein